MTLEDLTANTFTSMRKRLGLDRPLWERTMRQDSPFCQAVVAMGYLTQEQMVHAALRYRLGKTRNGGVIFWQINERDEWQDGKVMFYRNDCHRDHNRHPTWITALMKHQCGCDNIVLPTSHCLFGLHLMSTSPIAIVEAEKTAIILSEHFPQYIWMATGGLTELNVAKLMPLKGHRIILFPDTDPDGKTYQCWYDIAEAATDILGHPVTISSLLERNATPAQKSVKIDLVDYLFPAITNDHA